MGFKAIITNLLTGKKTTYVADPYSEEEEPAGLQAREFATFSAISYISAAFSLCEVRTFNNNKEIFGLDYYRFNTKTNRNQTAAEWKYEFMARLLFFGEALAVEWNDEILIADSFIRSKNSLGGDVFSNISREGIIIAQELQRSDVIYVKHDFGEIKQHISSLLSMYDSWLSESDKQMRRASGERGVFETTAIATGDTSERKKQVDFVRSRFKAYFSSPNSVFTAYNGEKYTPQTYKSTGKETDNLSVLVDNEIKLAALAFKIPPALFRGETTGVSDITRNFISIAVKPPATMICQELNAQFNGVKGMLKGNRYFIDYADIQYVDVFDVADKAEKLLGTSIFNVDDILRKIGEPTRNTESSTKYILSKNFAVEGEVNNND